MQCITCVFIFFLFFFIDTPSTLSTSNSSVSTISSRSIATLSAITRRSTFPYVKIDPATRRYRRIHKDRDSRFPEMENVFHREEDVLLCLQLLAYLSKYPHIRDLFHTSYNKNVFSVVEKFCHRLHPGPIQYWAGVIMRNACRKDESQGGIRRCANMTCGKWESQPREFAKCRRCRKAKYCSKSCQSKAWADGHRWWCVERHSSIVRDNNATMTTSLLNDTTATTTTTTNTVTATPATESSSTTSSSPAVVNDSLTDNAESSSSVERPMLLEMGMQL